MKKLSCVFVVVLTFGFLYPMFTPPVAAAGNEVIGQGITLYQTPVYISDAKGWRELGTIPANTQIAIYHLGVDYVQNAPNQYIPRHNIGVYGADNIAQTHWRSPLIHSSDKIWIGEAVHAKANCLKWSGPGCGEKYGQAGEDVLLQVVNKQGSWLFVLVKGDIHQPCWVNENDVYRRTNIVAYTNPDLGDLILIAVGPLVKHSAGNDSVPLVFDQVKQTVQTVLQGSGGTIYRRADGRMFIDTFADLGQQGVKRIVIFLDDVGQLGTAFAPGASDQVKNGVASVKAARYVENIVEKGGYWKINAGEIPQRIKELWLPTVTGSSFVVQFLNLAQSEVFFMMFIAPEDWNKYFEPQGLEPTNL